MPESIQGIHGIDEAGYGPLLGPLVVARSDLIPATARPGGLRVDDSKRFLSAARGRQRLEALLLAMAEEIQSRPLKTLRDWWALGGDPGDLRDLGALAWFPAADVSLPLFADPKDLEDARSALKAQGLAMGAEPTGFRFRVLTTPRFNAANENTGNKHETLFGLVGDLLMGAASMPGARRLIVDRLGGRRYYADKLVTLFPFRALEVVEETRRESRYKIDGEQGALSIEFLVKGDAREAAVSLASMIAKYTREALMALFNEYWRQRVPGIASTAGYTVDGRRFLADLAVAPQIAASEIDSLVRHR